MEFSTNILKNIAFAPNKKYLDKAFFARLSLFTLKLLEIVLLIKFYFKNCIFLIPLMNKKICSPRS